MDPPPRQTFGVACGTWASEGQRQQATSSERTYSSGDRTASWDKGALHGRCASAHLRRAHLGCGACAIRINSSHTWTRAVRLRRTLTPSLSLHSRTFVGRRIGVRSLVPLLLFGSNSGQAQGTVLHSWNGWQVATRGLFQGASSSACTRGIDAASLRRGNARSTCCGRRAARATRDSCLYRALSKYEGRHGQAGKTWSGLWPTRAGRFGMAHRCRAGRAASVGTGSNCRTGIESPWTRKVRPDHSSIPHPSERLATGRNLRTTQLRPGQTIPS